MSHELKNNSIWDEQKRLASRKNALWLRARMVQAIRLYFIKHDYLEVETPHIIPAPAPEVHINAISAGKNYLHTSPELYMKRLLAAGYSRIFQLSKCFREGERGNLHLPEFTLLEWYRTGIDYKALMAECEKLIVFVSKNIGTGERIYYHDSEIDLRSPWEKMSVNNAFDRYASLPLQKSLKNGLFDELMAMEIEPKLGATKPTFLYDYPASLASLARLKHDKRQLAERFEVYIGGVELANGFSELTDPEEQRSRFKRDQQNRHNDGKNVYPMPEKFLNSLEHMPEAAGIALGVDRLTILFAGKTRIDDVVSFTPEEL